VVKTGTPTAVAGLVSTPIRSIQRSAAGLRLANPRGQSCGGRAAQIALVRHIQGTHSNRAVQRLLRPLALGKPVAAEPLAHENAIGPVPPKAGTSVTGNASVPPPGDPSAVGEEAHRHPDPSVQARPAPLEQPLELSRDALGYPAADTAPQSPASPEPVDKSASSAASLPNANAVDEARQIKANSLRSEAEIAKIAASNRQQVTGAFAGLRTRFSTFFAQSSAGVQKFIASKQAQVTAAAAEVFQSAQAAVASTVQAVEGKADLVQQTINSTVQGIVASLQPRIEGIADQIVGVIDRFPLPDIPGVAQIRATAVGILRRGAAAVTGGLGRVGTLVNSALSAGMSVIRTVLAAAQRLANAALGQASRAIQRVIRMVAQVLSRTAGLIISALRRMFNAAVLPMLNDIERRVLLAIGKAQQQAVAAIRANRDGHLENLSAPAGSNSENARPSAAGGSESGGTAQEAIQTNSMIVRTFQERSSAIIASIVERVASGTAQIVQRIIQSVAQAFELIASKVREVIAGLGQIMQAVRNFIQSIVQAVTGTLTRVVEYVRMLVADPVDALVRFAQGVLGRMIDFISRLVRSVVDAITGSTPTEQTAQFVPPPALVPAPAFLGPAVPVVIAVLAAIVAFLGGSVTVIGGTVMIIIGGSVFFVSTTVVVVVAVVVVLLLLLLLLYLLYRLTRPRPKPPPPACAITTRTLVSAPDGTPDTRTTVGVNEPVEMTSATPAVWSTKHGTITTVSPTKALWTAPATGVICVVKAVLATGKVCLRLMNVVAPKGRALRRKTDTSYTSGLAGSGFVADVTIMPTNVSFSRVEVREESVNSVATGYYDTVLGWNGITHPVGSWLPVDASNSGIIDTVGSVPPGTGGPFSKGDFHWPIPQSYRIAGSSGGGSVYSTGNHTQTMTDATGEETTSKEGASRTRTP